VLRPKHVKRPIHEEQDVAFFIGCKGAVDVLGRHIDKGSGRVDFLRVLDPAAQIIDPVAAAFVVMAWFVVTLGYPPTRPPATLSFREEDLEPGGP
jgi:hypothetical protein